MPVFACVEVEGDMGMTNQSIPLRVFLAVLEVRLVASSPRDLPVCVPHTVLGFQAPVAGLAFYLCWYLNSDPQACSGRATLSQLLLSYVFVYAYVCMAWHACGE